MRKKIKREMIVVMFTASLIILLIVLYKILASG